MTHATYRTWALAAGVTLLLTGQAAAQGQSCSDFIPLAEAGVPTEVGDKGKMAMLLAPSITTPQLSRGFNMKTAMRALGDGSVRADKTDCPNEKPGTSLRGKTISDENTDPATEAECRYRNRKGSVLRLKMAEGEIAYLNPSRRFDVFKGADNKVPSDAAADVVRRTALAFGVPPAEVDLQRAEVRSLMLAGQLRDELKMPGEIHRAEVHVRFPRHVGGTPVFDSWVQGAVDVSARVARLHVRWPDFGLVPGLSAADALPRSAVVEGVVEALGEGHLCGSLDRIEAHVAYVDAAEVAASDGRDEVGEASSADERGLLPALVVYAVPNEPREDSGEISMGAQQLMVPLLMPHGADMASG